MTKSDEDPLGAVDTTGLTDADWAEINKLKRAHDTGDPKAFSKAYEELSANPVKAIRVIGAFFPDMVREAIRDSMAENGITEEDLREMILKAERPTRQQ
jgi:hypothetical protein